MVEAKDILIEDIKAFLLKLQRRQCDFKFKIIENQDKVEIWIKRFQDGNTIEHCYSFSSFINVNELVDLQNELINEIVYN
jgi:hypothetical protein